MGEQVGLSVEDYHGKLFGIDFLAWGCHVLLVVVTGLGTRSIPFVVWCYFRTFFIRL